MKKSMKLTLLAVVIVSISILAINWKTWFVYPKYYAIVKQHLKDPDSTKFRNSFMSKTDCCCGEFNSKNSSGGYVGFNRFIVSGNKATIEGTEILGSDAYLDAMQSEIEILKERKSRADHGEKLEYLSEVDRRKKALPLAFEKTWARDCVK